MANPPRPGVSTLPSSGPAQPISGTRARDISPDAPPLGTSTSSVRQVQEIPLPVRRRSSQYEAVYLSVDGSEYRFRTHDTKGLPVPRRNELCLFLALREAALGGTPELVMDAFRLQIQDADGLPVFPITDESRSSAEAATSLPLPSIVDSEDDEGIVQAFTLGNSSD